MKKIFTIVVLLQSVTFFAQKSSYLQADYFYGNIIAHHADAHAFLQGHPTGAILSYNKRLLGSKNWHNYYNYPDFGYSFSYQNYNSSVLGELYALYGHYNFYFFNRLAKNKLILRAGIGLAYATKPYDKVTNNKNTALGSTINSSTYFKLYYQRENIIKNLGVNAGLTFIHASNSNFRSPNAGVNIWAAAVGLNYNLDTENTLILKPTLHSKKFTEPIQYNFTFHTGINESEIIGTGQKPFFVISGYADKRLSKLSAIQLGTDVFFSPMLKDYYEINKSIPHSNLKETSNFTRVGVFIGHELFISTLSVVTQFGYYAVYPVEYEGRIYETLGLKKYFNKKWFASVRLKAHAANAETVEFGLGYRF